MVDSSVLALILTFGIDIGIFTGQFIIFAVYRTIRSRPLYLDFLDESDLKVPPFSESDTSLWSLLKIVWSVPYSEVNYYCGLEGQLYLAFHLVLGWGTFFVSVVVCGVLIPIYAAGSGDVENDINVLSMAHIINDEDLMVAVLIFFFLVSILGIIITITYIRYVSEAYSNEFDLSITIDRYTVHIQGLPEGFVSEVQEGIWEIMEERFPEHVQNVYVVPDISKAYKANLKMAEAKRQLERYKEYEETYGERLKIKTSLCSVRRDAIRYYENLVEKYEAKYEKSMSEDKKMCSGTAFLLCATSLCAYNIVNEFKGTKDRLRSDKWELKMAPAPGEINWENIAKQKRKRIWIRIGLLIVFIVVFFLLVTPLTILTSINYVLDLLGLGDFVQVLLGQLLPSIILLVYLSVIIRHTVKYMVSKERLSNKSEETSSALIKYLIVMVTYTFLVPLIGIQVFSILYDIFDTDIDEWENEIADDAADAGLFFSIFIIHLTFLKNGGDFMQLPKFLRVKFRQMRALNERERLLAYEAYEFRWAYEYGISLSAYMIIMAFSVSFPLILPIGALFYVSRYFTAKYNLLCFYCTVKTTTGNKVTRDVTASILIGILIFQMLTCMLILLNPTTVYIALSSSLIGLSIMVFLIIYSKRFQIETELKRGFRFERMEEEGFISKIDIKNYMHPLHAEVDAPQATIE